MIATSVSMSLLLLMIGASSACTLQDQQSASLQLQQLLAPVLQQAALWAQPKALTQLVRLQLAIEQLQLPQQNTEYHGADVPLSQEPKPPSCDVEVSPVSSDGAPVPPPSTLACARSCLQLRDQSPDQLQDGVYWLTGLPGPVYCDFSHDGGGWTLLLTAVSKQGWDVLSALERNVSSPSLADNYSILRHADSIRDLGTGDSFAYRIEAQADTGRRRWGGVWFAPRSYSFLQDDTTQTNVKLVRRFDKWSYNDNGIERLMPWLNVDGLSSNDPYILTTSGSGNWWGTLVTHEWEPSYDHSPWLLPEAPRSGTVLYWMREEAF